MIASTQIEGAGSRRDARVGRSRSFWLWRASRHVSSLLVDGRYTPADAPMNTSTACIRGGQPGWAPAAPNVPRCGTPRAAARHGWQGAPSGSRRTACASSNSEQRGLSTFMDSPAVMQREALRQFSLSSTAEEQLAVVQGSGHVLDVNAWCAASYSLACELCAALLEPARAVAPLRQSPPSLPCWGR